MMLSDCVFATLTPLNVAAKLAFSAAVDATAVQDGSTIQRCHMQIDDQPVFDPDVCRSLQSSTIHAGLDDIASGSSTDFDSDTATDRRNMIWRGHYMFDDSNPPLDPEIGWAAGTGSRGTDAGVDFLTIAKGLPNGVRRRHATFNFHINTGHLYIISHGSSGGTSRVAVNGRTIARGESHALNQKLMNIRLGPLEYLFDYTDFASTPAFSGHQQEYARRFLGVEKPNFDLTPTPTGKPWAFGDWTINIALGRGAFGKVYSATDSKSRVVAIKFVERGQNNAYRVDREVQTLRDLTKLSETEDDKGRLLRLVDVVYQNGNEDCTTTHWDDIALICQPVVLGTFEQLVESAVSQRDQSLAISLFKDALQGVDFLHSHGWIHGDLKPSNIGITGLRAVLLDTGSAIRIHDGQTVPPTPGDGGTISYIAPEREMQDYSSLADIWSMGVVGYEILFGRHPWPLPVNPWRPGAVYESRRPVFHQAYKAAMDRLRCSTYEHSSQFGNLLIDMLRHPWAEGNVHDRINVQDALNHFCWPVLSPQPASKRARGS